MIQNISSLQVGFGVLLAILAWLATRVVDILGKKFLEKRIFSRVWNAIKWRYRAFKTRFKPLSSTFSVSYYPDSNTSVKQFRSKLESAIEDCENRSQQRISTDELSWSDPKTANTRFEYSSSESSFDVVISLKRDTEDLRKRPNVDATEEVVSYATFEFTFEFAFKDLSEVIADLDTMMDFLVSSLDANIGGKASSGQFTIAPIEDALSLSQWIDEEGFEVSIRLSDEDKNQTEVNLYSDKAEIRPPYLQIDSEVIRYIRAIILDHYLKPD